MSVSNHYRWLVVAVTVINQAVMTGIGLYCFAIFSIPWLERFDVSRGQLMLAISIFQVANSLVAPFLGRKLDQMSLMWPVITGYVLFCIGLGLLSIANAYWQIIAVYGTFFAVSQILAGSFISQMLINRWFADDKGLALGVSATGTSLGGIVFPLVITQALLTFELATVFQTLLVVFVVVMIPLNYAVLRVQPPLDSQSSADGGAQAKVAPAPSWTTRQILSSKAFWIPLSILLMVSTSFVAMQANLGVHLNDLDYAAAFTGQMIALTSAMMVIGKLLYGRLGDKIDHAYLLLFMGVLNIAAMALFMTATTKIPLLLAAALLGLSGGGLLPVMGIVFAARFGIASFGKVMGLVVLLMAAASLGSVYAAWTYDLFGSYNSAFITFIVLTLPGILLLRWLPAPLGKTA